MWSADAPTFMRRMPSSVRASSKVYSTPDVLPSYSTLLNVLAIEDRPPMVQPHPIRPSVVIWLLYTNLSSGFSPPTPVGHSMGISYVAAPVGLTLNSPCKVPTAKFPAAYKYEQENRALIKIEKHLNFI